MTSDPLAPFLAGGGALVLDGGLATELEKAGFDLDHPLWSARLLATAPEAITSVHRALPRGRRRLHHHRELPGDARRLRARGPLARGGGRAPAAERDASRSRSATASGPTNATARPPAAPGRRERRALRGVPRERRRVHGRLRPRRGRAARVPSRAAGAARRPRAPIFSPARRSPPRTKRGRSARSSPSLRAHRPG